MPVYEYRCTECGEITDIRHGFDEEHTEPCEKCKGKLARKFTVSGISFKGSGFYVNDSRSGGSSTPDSSSAA